MLFELGISISPIYLATLIVLHISQSRKAETDNCGRTYITGMAVQNRPEYSNGICGVNQASYCLWIFEISGQSCPVIIPGFMDFRVLGIPFIFEQF